MELSASRALSPLEALPPALFHVVMAFHLSSDRPEHTHDRTDAVGELTRVAMVSKAVRASAKEMQAMLILGQLGVSPWSTTRSKVLDLRRRVTLRRAFLRDMVVDVEPDQEELPREQRQAWLMRMSRQIAVLLSQAPKLELLDLRKFLGAPDQIVLAAAHNCPQLKVLLLPSAEMYETLERAGGRALERASLVDAVLYGMRQWRSSNGGLRQLRLPNRHDTQRFAKSVEFLRTVSEHCRDIELLDGYGLVQSDKEGWSLTKAERTGHCGDEWIVDQATWDLFCQSCTKLREFDWATAPWASPFFEIFSKHPKPQLAWLKLQSPMIWNWHRFMAEGGTQEASEVRAAGFGATATGVVAVLEACPALKKLSVVLNSRVGEDDPDLIGAMLELTGDEVPVNHPPLQLQNMMNQELFDAAFCAALARLCPELEEFSLKEEHEELATIMKRVKTIAGFDDTALQYLAMLPHLSTLNLKAVTVTGSGLFQFVNSTANKAIGQRVYKCVIGDASSHGAPSFYRQIHNFLVALVDHQGPLHLETQRIFLRIANGNWGEVGEELSASFLRVLKRTLRAASDKFPSLQFRVEVDGLTDATFTTIYAFGFFTATAKPPTKAYWTEPRILVDDVFVIHDMLKDCQDDVANEYREFERERDEYMDREDMDFMDSDADY